MHCVGAHSYDKPCSFEYPISAIDEMRRKRDSIVNAQVLLLGSNTMLLPFTSHNYLARTQC